LERYAPVLEIDVVADYDKPGTVLLDVDGQAHVNTERAAVYSRIAHTLFEGRPHLQLVYTLWFSERPPDSVFDVLAGRLDGFVWRVTLDDDGAPLLYDSTHSCGCFHQFFPTPRLRSRPQPTSLDEAALTPQSLPTLRPGERVSLRLSSGKHYLQRVELYEPSNVDATSYRLKDEHLLRRLPFPTATGVATRSLYNEDGLVAGSERGERFFFWPMGITSAGQMRQWGRHATAFVGRRHFDDAHLLDRYFERVW
jgi:hypothetical protein